MADFQEILEFKATENVTEITQSISASLSRLDGTLNKLHTQISGVFKKSENSVKDFGDTTSSESTKSIKNMQQIGNIADIAIGNIVADAFGRATGAALNFFRASAGTGIDFQKQLSSIKALTGATEEDMKRISLVAKEAGQKTNYSPLESAKGIEELIKAGVSLETIMSGGVYDALNLASAGGIEVADSAIIASTALNAFRRDNLNLTKATDIVAGAANASATDINELKYAMQSSSAVASGVNMSFLDMNTALAVFAQNGLKGSDSGTSLKTMLLNLQPSTKAQVNLFRELGLETLDVNKGYQFLESQGVKTSKSIDSLGSGFVELAQKQLGTQKVNDNVLELARKLEVQSGFSRSAFFDEAGQIRSLSEVSGVLQTALKGQTDAQRLASLEILFGTDAIRAANILYLEGAEGINKMQAEMMKFTAMDVAAEKTNNTAGAINRFNAALETKSIEIWTGLLPTVSSGLDNISQQINKIDVEKIKEFLGNPLVQATLVALGSSILPVLGLAIVNLTVYLWGLNMALLTTTVSIGVITAPLWLLMAVFAAVGAALFLFSQAWQNDWGSIRSSTEKVVNDVSKSIGDAWYWVTTKTKETTEGVKKFFVDGFVQILNQLGLDGEALKTKMEEITNNIITTIKSLIDRAVEEFMRPIREAQNALNQLKMQGVGGAVNNAKSQIQGQGFANGGIVGGSSYTGDRIPIRVNSGEEVVTASDRKTLIAVMSELLSSGGGSGARSIEIGAVNINNQQEQENFLDELTRQLLLT